MESPYTALVSTDVLAAHLDDPDWAVVDCRFDLARPVWGRTEYEASHVPGAVYADLDRDLSSSPTGTNGRHPLPAPDVLARTFSAWGIDASVQVVAYDQDAGMFASRLWWMLRWLGHPGAAVLDGGLAAWTRDEHPTASGSESRPGRRFEPAVDDRMLADAEAVARAIGSDVQVLIDARAPERFEGRTEPLDPVAGHIPGAVNRFFKDNLRADGTFRSPDSLRQDFERILASSEAPSAICYCGSGVTACHDLLALEHAGLLGARLYAGSWSEWCSDPGRPTESGPART